MKTYMQALREFQGNLLVQSLIETKGNQSEAARLLDIHRNTFSRMLENATLLPCSRVRTMLREAGVIIQ